MANQVPADTTVIRVYLRGLRVSLTTCERLEKSVELVEGKGVIQVENGEKRIIQEMF